MTRKADISSLARDHLVFSHCTEFSHCKNCESSTARSAGEASSVTAEHRAKRGAMRSAGAGRAIPLLRLFTLANIVER